MFAKSRAALCHFQPILHLSYEEKQDLGAGGKGGFGLILWTQGASRKAGRVRGAGGQLRLDGAAAASISRWPRAAPGTAALRGQVRRGSEPRSVRTCRRETAAPRRMRGGSRSRAAEPGFFPSAPPCLSGGRRLLLAGGEHREGFPASLPAAPAAARPARGLWGQRGSPRHPRPPPLGAEKRPPALEGTRGLDAGGSARPRAGAAGRGARGCAHAEAEARGRGAEPPGGPSAAGRGAGRPRVGARNKCAEAAGDGRVVGLRRGEGGQGRAGGAGAEGAPRRGRRQRGEGGREALGPRRAGGGGRERGAGPGVGAGGEEKEASAARGRARAGPGGGEEGREERRRRRERGRGWRAGEGREGARGEAEGEEAAGLRDWVTGRLPGPGGSAANSQAALKE